MNDTVFALFMTFAILCILCAILYAVNELFMLMKSVNELCSARTPHEERSERPRDRAKDWLDNKRGGVK